MMYSLKRRDSDEHRHPPQVVTRKPLQFMKMYTFTRSALLLVLFLLLSATTLAAQSRSTIPRADPPASEEEEERFGSSIREMRQRSYFERLNAEHKLNIKRASEGAALASDLLRAFNRNRALSANDLENLEKLEKIARRIRGYAGGSDDDRGSDSAAPVALGESLSQIADLTSVLQQEVARTARQVVSAKLIADANRVIFLVRQARNFTRQPLRR